MIKKARMWCAKLRQDALCPKEWHSPCGALKCGATEAVPICSDVWKVLKGGERVGIRTQDPLIKSQMLYRLSYALPFGVWIN